MALNLSATTHIIEVTTTGAGSVVVEVSFIDDLAGVKTGGSQTTAIASATTTTVCSAPAASTVRGIEEMSVVCVAGNTITIKKDVSAVETTLLGPLTLVAGERAQFVSARGWRVFNADGSEKVGATSTVVPDGDKGDITVSSSGTVWTIDNNVITHAKEAQPAANTLTGNPTAGVANAQDITLAVQSLLLRAAGNIVNVAATASQWLGRGLSGDLAFQLKGLVASNVTMPAATNATTNLTCGGAFSVPANTLVAGDVYRVTGMYHYVHTAAATPTITIEFLINAVVIAAVTLVLTPIATASNYTGTVVAYLRAQTTGAGGTCVVALDQKNSFVAFARASIENAPTAAPATTAIDTTVARTIELRMRMTTAVAANTLTVVHGFVEKL